MPDVIDGTATRTAMINEIMRLDATASRDELSRLDHTALARRFSLVAGGHRRDAQGSVSAIRFDSDTPPSHRQDTIMKDAYGRPVYGASQSLLSASDRRDEDDAYRRSVERINANRADRDVTAGTTTITAAEKKAFADAQGNERDDEARAYAASVERLNASRTKQHPAGQPVKF